MAHGEFYWNELMTHDVEKAKAFFTETVGWSFEGMAMPEGFTYWVAKLGDKPVGGVMSMLPDMPPGTPSHWLSYLNVADIDTQLTRITPAGGQILRSAFDVAGVGRIAIIADPTGAVMGWITPVDCPDTAS